ncbi:MAG: carbamoyl transferase [Desulfobacterales bacterium]|nr:carbamoyl transferase [Desulfobacterales bacterium]
MYIISLHNDEDSGVCLLKNDKILEAVNEERFNRIKLYKGIPRLSFEYVLKKYDLSVEDIDYFVYPWYGKKNNYPEYIQKLVDRINLAANKNSDALGIIKERLETEFKNDEKTRKEFEHWIQKLNVSEDKVIYSDHHHCHAWSAFACSPFDKAFVFTFDGRGDLKSATASFASKENGIYEYDYLMSMDSLGYLYGQITKYLGFTPHRHEGKVTGLAAYGNPRKTLPLFNELITWKNDAIVANIGLYQPFFTMKKELKDKLNFFTHEDIAAGVQTHCENLVVQYIKYWIRKIDKPDVKNVCLSGGVFANVKLNQRAREIPGVDNVYIFPHMGDGGLSVGGAAYLLYLLTQKATLPLPTVYLGTEFSNNEIHETLKSYSEHLDIVELGDKLVESTVQDLIEEKVVGYFNNRMEFGPRALGARSILYHAGDKSVNDWLNKRLARTEFMPFAPVTPVEYASDCYADWSADHICSQFMTMTYDCTEPFKTRHEAVVHVDGTARPQIITKDINGEYYDIVRTYCDITGNKALINTSFNAHEEPIVCKPEDAIENLLNNRIDILVIGNYRATKK